MALVLTAIMTEINFDALYAVMHGLLLGAKGATGESLLLDALNIWFRNVVVERNGVFSDRYYAA